MEMRRSQRAAKRVADNNLIEEKQIPTVSPAKKTKGQGAHGKQRDVLRNKNLNDLAQETEDLELLSKEELIKEIAQLRALNSKLRGADNTWQKQDTSSKSTLDQFARLPDKLVVNIFSMLPNIEILQFACVCKRWKALMEDKQIWEEVDLDEKIVYPGVLGKILDRGTRILQISFCDITDSAIVLDPRVKHSQLEILYMNCISISHRSFWYLIRCCPSLKRLIISDFYVTDEICEAIGKIKSLEELTISMCKDFSQFGVSAMVRGCKRLTALKMSYIRHFPEASIKAVVNNVPETLEILDLCGSAGELNDNHVRILSTRCPNISQLHTGYSERMTAKSIEHILQMKKLVQLSLDSTEIPINSICRLRELKSLEMLSVSDEWPKKDIAHVVKALPGVIIDF